MFYIVAYAPTVSKYNAVLHELKCYKADLITLVLDNELEQWLLLTFVWRDGAE